MAGRGGFNRGSLAFGGSGSGRSKFQSLRASDAQPDDARGRPGSKHRRQLNANFIKKAGDGAAATVDNSAVLQREAAQDELDARMGFPLFTDGPDRLGWLMNFTATAVEDKETGQVKSAVSCFFMCQNGDMFKCKVPFAPYFYLQVKDEREVEVEAILRRKFEGMVKCVDIVHKEDLDLKNHLTGIKRRLMKVSFASVQQLMEVRNEVMPVVQRNKARVARTNAYVLLNPASSGPSVDALEAIEDIREYDVSYHTRFAIDMDVRAGYWYNVACSEGHVALRHRADLVARGEPRICAFDIETTKLPLHFPNSEHDQVFMISYMVDRQGYLIVNRKVVGGDIADFEFTPKPEFPGKFRIFNEADEEATLRRWFAHMRETKPAIYVTYNGDFFDWPFIEARAKHHGMDMFNEIGFRVTKSGEALSRSAIHMDCLCWVNRDSYLPQGSRGLKAVTKTKLGYDPVEVDPEDMVPFAQTHPQAMASYSVSDAVATYYLYMTYIHPFICSLATIIPMPPDEVLRKGSGTLCEQLLMVEAFRGNIVCPNKHTDAGDRKYGRHLLATETYIGGKVEAIESGVFRSDLPCRFKTTPAAYQGLIDRLDQDLRYGLEVECKVSVDDVENYEEVRGQIQAGLEALRDTPVREEVPLIYHLDVAAMYPNIILTNRLQPSAIVTDEDCAACDYNHPDKKCLRPMEWVWRGETYALTMSEYYMLKNQFETEQFPPLEEGGKQRLGKDLPEQEFKEKLTERIKKYTQKVYKRVVDKPVTETRVAGICQRENGFYVDTVRAFRDRRYEYKGLNKKWKNALSDAQGQGDKVEVSRAKDMCVLYDSLQLAHKCILNSFYGYVMRKGARWYSMEMAGVTTYTGAQIIKRACDLIELIGRPLELDTDGIWCCLPGSFPEEFKFRGRAAGDKPGKQFKISYPGLVLNVMCAEHNTNSQYHELVAGPDGAPTYQVSSQMSIEFEVDGPYLAMVLPASKEEGKLIKKRYAVFNFDGSLAELKGFEIKRRGELKLIKVFQSEVFSEFLAGKTLDQCYAAVGAVANRWLDLLDTHGIDLQDSELIGYISESSMMSKSLDDYGDRKSSAITTAKRLSQFLGDERIKEKGLACNYVISKKPSGSPTSERAIPVTIFSAEPSVARTYLRKWCGDCGTGDPASMPDVREFVDWDYYRERLSSAIQKIITIPAAYQCVSNPVPRVPHPDWLRHRVAAATDPRKQMKMDALFQAKARPGGKGAPPQQGLLPLAAPLATADADGRRGRADDADGGDIEDMDDLVDGAARARRQVKRRKLARLHRLDSDDDDADEANANPAPGPEQENVDSNRGAGGAEARGGDDDGGGDDGDARAPSHTNAAGLAGPRPRGGPKMHDDYAAWLAARKSRWRGRREALTGRQDPARRHRGPGGASAAAADLGALGGGMQRAITAVLRGTWNVVQVLPTKAPGVLQVWALVDSAMHRLTVTVPRRIYVELAAEHNDVMPHAKRVTRTLPDGSLPSCLIELEYSEEQYLEEATSMAGIMTQPDIRGCHEAQLPPDTKALIHLTCMAHVVDASLVTPPPSGFCLDQLAARASNTASYLAGSGPEGFGVLRLVGVHFTDLSGAAGAGARGLVLLSLPVMKRLCVVVVQGDRAAPRDLHRVIVEDLLHDATAQDDDAAFPMHDFAVEVEYADSLAAGYAAVNRKTAEFRTKHRGPTLVLVEASGGAAALRPHLSLLREAPTCDVAPAASPPELPRHLWQAPAVRAALPRLLRFRPWLSERIQAARYAAMPVGNLGADVLLSMADLMFARTLHTSGHLLWVRDPRLPQLLLQASDPLLDLDFQPLEINNRGAHRCVCVELRVHLLLLNAVMQSAELAELEGSSINDGRHGRTLRLLRDLLSGLASDAVNRREVVADSLLRNLQRWMADSRSAMHCPSLLALVKGLMNKVFLQLTADIRKLDATIVSASLDSIVISTGKHDLKAAESYVQYLTKTLARRELFAWLQLPVARSWHTLLWRDRFNFAGIAVDPSDGPQYISCWNIRNFLPPAVHRYFDETVKQFVSKPWAHVQGQALQAAATQGGNQTMLLGKAVEASVAAYLLAWVPAQLLDRLFRMTSEVASRVLLGSAAPEANFPRLPGAHVPPRLMGTPALAFVRTICEVLSLDERVKDEVCLLRKQLLAVLHVKEFSPEAAFRDPCLPVVLRDVMCEHCGCARDVDVCRDAVSADDSDTWRCTECSRAYSAATMEGLLSSKVNSLVVAFLQQDLKCIKCRNVSRGGMAVQCDLCGGELQHCMAPEAATQELQVLKSVAAFHGMTLLEEQTEWGLASADTS